MVDSERQRLRLAGYVSGNYDGGAELADRADESEQSAGEDAAVREGQGYGEGDADRAGAEAARGAFESLVHALHGDHDRAGGERERHDGGGERGGEPGKDDFPSQRGVEQPSERTVASEEQQQRVADDDGRHRERQRRQDIQQERAAYPLLDD